MKRHTKTLLDGIVNNNPSFKLVLGTCATLALSSSVLSGLGMGLSVTLILVLSNIIISALRKLIPATVRMPCFVVLIATLVTIMRMALYKYLPDIYDSMGIFLPLIVVNCLLFARAESFASKKPVIDSAIDGFANGIGYTLALTVISIIREFLGNGSFFGIKIMDFKIGFFSSAAGAFFVYGICIALFVFITEKINKEMRINRINRELTEGIAGGKYLLTEDK